MDERMLATVAVQMFNEHALKISFECAICGTVFKSKLDPEEISAAPVLDCPNGCVDRWYTRDADGTLRERPCDARGMLITE